ncbi:hypothetical protein ACFL43_07150, partial [Thermodesulfobacteriota bacterium]
MTKKILALCMGLVMAVAFCGTAAAGEAVRVYIELDKTSVSASSKHVTAVTAVSSGAIIRGRVLLLDANDELATTFNGASIADGTLEIQSTYQDDVNFSTDPVTTETADLSWEAAAEKVSINISEAYQEFAIAYANLDELKTDTLTVTLKKSGESITGTSASITVKAPSMTGYVIRTSNVSAIPDVMGKIADAKSKSDKGVKEAGDSVRVNCFAGYTDNNGDWRLTDNLKTGTDVVSLSGSVTTYKGSNINKSVESSGATLVGGVATVDVTVSDLDIPDVLAMGLYMGAITTPAAQMEFIDSAMSWGMTLTWKAKSTVTKTQGDSSSEVGTTGNIELDLNSRYVSSDDDTSFHKPGAAKKITIIPIYANQIPNDFAPTAADATNDTEYVGMLTPTGSIAAGQVSEDAIEGFAADISPLDAWLLNGSPYSKPSKAVKVAGEMTNTAAFLAVVAYDANNNPAAIGEASGTATVALASADFTSAGDTDTTDSRHKGVFPCWLGSGAGSAYELDPGAGVTSVTTTYNYQAFLPFYVTSSYEQDVDNLYIDAANCSNVDTDLVEDIDTATEGIDMDVVDYVGAITSSSAILSGIDGTQAADKDVEISAAGRTGASSQETSFTMSAKRKYDGATVEINVKDSTSGASSLQIPNDDGVVAAKDVAFFTATPGYDTIFAQFKGASSGVIATQAVSLTTGIAPADGGDFAVSGMFTSMQTINTLIDETVNTLELTNAVSGPLFIADAFGNSYNDVFGGSSLEDAKMTVGVYKAADNGSATATAFPGADADIDTETLTIEFDRDNVDAATDTAVVKLAGGSQSIEIKVNINAMQLPALETVFVPVKTITNTPVKVYMANQDGSSTKPCYDGANAANGTVTVDLDGNVDNGTVSDSTPDITTDDSSEVITAILTSGKSMMKLTGDADDYGETSLVITYDPDFQLPVVGTLVAIDCGFEIPITDNIGVDEAATALTVTVKDATGDDITS